MYKNMHTEIKVYSLYKKLETYPSPIQTILSALEFH
jgi:hypothetical protein